MECGCGRSPIGQCIGWHKLSEEEAKIMLVEPRGVINTGDVKNELTAENDQWI